MPCLSSSPACTNNSCNGPGNAGWHALSPHPPPMPPLLFAQNQPPQMQDDSAKWADSAVHPWLTNQFINDQDTNDSVSDDDNKGFLSRSVTWPQILRCETNPLKLTHAGPTLHQKKSTFLIPSYFRGKKGISRNKMIFLF